MRSLSVHAFGGHLGLSFSVVAVVAHVAGILFLVVVRACIFLAGFVGWRGDWLGVLLGNCFILSVIVYIIRNELRILELI